MRSQVSFGSNSSSPPGSDSSSAPNSLPSSPQTSTPSLNETLSSSHNTPTSSPNPGKRVGKTTQKKNMPITTAFDSNNVDTLSSSDDLLSTSSEEKENAQEKKYKRIAKYHDKSKQTNSTEGPYSETESDIDLLSESE